MQKPAIAKKGVVSYMQRLMIEMEDPVLTFSTLLLWIVGQLESIETYRPFIIQRRQLIPIIRIVVCILSVPLLATYLKFMVVARMPQANCSSLSFHEGGGYLLSLSSY